MAVLNSPAPYDIWSDGATAINSDLGGIFEAHPQLAEVGDPKPCPVAAGDAIFHNGLVSLAWHLLHRQVSCRGRFARRGCTVQAPT